MVEKSMSIPRRKIGEANLGLRGRGNANAPLKSLELVHVTAVGAAREIVQSGQINTQRCKVFGAELVYFFLARPAYRMKEGNRKSDQINRFPFVLIVSPNNLGPPHHVYPFDTGGAVAGVFGERVDPYVCLEDYELDPDLEAAAKHIDWAFGTPQAYFEGDLRVEIGDTLNPWEDVARGFLTIAKLATSGHNQPDKRASAIEIAYSNNIPLVGNAQFAIIPKQYLEYGSNKNNEFIDRLLKLGIPWDIYDWRPNETPDFYLDEITRIARNYFQRSGQL